MVMRTMIIMITIVVLMYKIIMKNSREEDKNISPLPGKRTLVMVMRIMIILILMTTIVVLMY